MCDGSGTQPPATPLLIPFPLKITKPYLWCFFASFLYFTFFHIYIIGFVSHLLLYSPTAIKVGPSLHVTLSSPPSIANQIL